MLEAQANSPQGLKCSLEVSICTSVIREKARSGRLTVAPSAAQVQQEGMLS